MSTRQEVGVAPPVRGRRRLRLARLKQGGYVLLCQLLILAVALGLWEYATAWNKQAAFMFGSPSAIARMLAAAWWLRTPVHSVSPSTTSRSQL